MHYDSLAKVAWRKETTDNPHDIPIRLAITDAWQAICATGRLSPGHPGFGKMAILQANPITLRSCQGHKGLCNRPLPLSQTDHVQTLPRLHALLLSKSLHTSYSVGRLTTHARSSVKLMTQADWCKSLGTVSYQHNNCMLCACTCPVSNRSCMHDLDVLICIAKTKALWSSQSLHRNVATHCMY